MKTILFLTICLIFLSLLSCNTKSNSFDKVLADDMCKLKSNDWECKVYSNVSDSFPIPNGLSKPIVAVEFISSKTNDSNIFVYAYSINQKKELEIVIQESMKNANCVPVFLGENKKYYIITSSCYVNSSFFLDNQNLKSNAVKLFTQFNTSYIR
jgi:hypothetical protein